LGHRLGEQIRKPDQSKKIEATLWMAIFSREFSYEGVIAAVTTARASDIGVRLLIEDYSRLNDDGVPTTIWLND
jgi:hypothetical protein